MKCSGLSIVAFLLAALPLRAQTPITIDKSDMPQAGKYYVQSDALPGSSLQLNKVGPNQVWDFSNLTPVSQSTDTFKSMGDVDPLYRIYFGFNTPNLVMPMGGLPLDSAIPMVPSDALSFLKNETGKIAVTGMGFKMQGLPLAVPYDKPDVIYTFPLTFKKQDSSFSSFTMSLPGFFYYHRDQQRRWRVDGWGKIITPYGKWDVLRTMTILDEQDTFYLDTLHNGTTFYPPRTIEYKWIAKGMGQAVMTVSGNEMNGSFVPTSVSYMDSSRRPAGIESESEDSKHFSLWPNPFNEQLHILNPSNKEAQADILDISGRLIFSVRLKPGHNSLPMGDLKSGVYLLKTADGVMKVVKE